MQVDRTQRKLVILPVLTARTAVPLPHLVVTMTVPHDTAANEDWQLCEQVVWEPAARALEQRHNRQTANTRAIWIALVPQAAIGINDNTSPPPPATSPLHSVGCLARVVQIKRIERQAEEDGPEPEESATVAIPVGRPASFLLTLEMVKRLRVHELITQHPFIKARCELLTQPTFEQQVTAGDSELSQLAEELTAGIGNLLATIQELSSLPTEVRSAIDTFIRRINLEHVPDVLCNFLDGSSEERIALLNALELKPRMQLILAILNGKLADREALKRQLLARLAPLDRLKRLMPSLAKQRTSGFFGGDSVSSSGEGMDEIFDRVRQAKLPESVRKMADRELKRLEKISPAQAEYSVIRTYLEWIVDLPWQTSSDEVIDLAATRQQLDKDHYGMEKVKTRILQYMAVRKLRKDLKGPILCLVGPPGVGKTSLGKSVAKATGRRFHRIALGGARDVAEIKGHRRTYVGALPGLIVQGLKTVGVNNPVFLLDEIDKLGSDPLRGDPSSALLEVLDPEQNNSFQDHYLGIPFDLSRVLFIATANSLETIPAPLRDRMEIIRLAGYTSDEKMFIAQNYLVPKQLVEHGLTGEDLKLEDEILIQVTNDYTAEAGVRSLERQIAALCRSVAMQVLDERERNLERQVPRSITAADVENILGPPKIIRDLAERTTKPGIITGLSYSSIGAGSILFIEVACYPGDGQLCLTGSLGDVIRESSQIALSWVRSHAHQLQISPAMMMMTSNVDRQVALPFNKINVHVHFPAGAVSKDGPSAGIAICTALVSFLTGTPCQPLVAMTGELTLRGNVLPIGGVKEKVLAAHRAGIKRIILPDQNHKDVIADVPESVKREIEFVYCKRIDQVLRLSLGTQIFRTEPLVDSRL